MQTNSSEKSGATILILGVVLLILTFIIATVHLYGEIDIIPIPSLFASFGEALSPLLEAGIRILYLGLMGWIALTIIAKGRKLIVIARIQEKTNNPSE